MHREEGASACVSLSMSWSCLLRSFEIHGNHENVLKNAKRREFDGFCFMIVRSGDTRLVLTRALEAQNHKWHKLQGWLGQLVRMYTRVLVLLHGSFNGCGREPC